MSGVLANASISGLQSPSPAATEAPTAVSAEALAPADLGLLAAGTAGASYGAKGSQVLLLSVTTIGGFCVAVLAVAAAVFCFVRQRRGRQQADVEGSKPSQASAGGSGHGDAPKPSPHQTTPKGLRQAYAKAAGLHEGTMKALPMTSYIMMALLASISCAPPFPAKVVCCSPGLQYLISPW